MSCHTAPMTCGHVPADLKDTQGRTAHPLPPLAILPGDPLPLRRDLARLAAEHPTPDDIPWPTEESA